MNNDHILSTFDNDLNRLNKDLLKLAKLATEQFVNSIDNFSTQNIDDIDQLISNDKNLDDLDEFKGMLTTTEFMAQQIVNHFIEIAKKNSIDISKLFSIKVTLNESHIAAASYEKNLNE